MKSRRSWTWVLPLALAGALGGLGCAADAGSARDADETDQAAQPSSKEDHRGPAEGRNARGHRPPPGGPDFLLIAALRELDLTDAQRTTIEQALETSRPGHDGPRAQHRAAFQSLADGVRKGKVDVAAVVAAAPAGPSAEQRAAAASAVGTLHATLTKEQRRALVDAIEDKMGEHGPRGPKGRHHGPPGPDDGDERHRGGPLGRLLHDLDLTEAQRDAIERAVAADRPDAEDRAAHQERFEQMRAEMKARLESFANDSFDATAFVTPPKHDGPHAPKHHLERLAKHIAAIAPLLQPEQRDKLAAKLEQGPPSHPAHKRR